MLLLAQNGLILVLSVLCSIVLSRNAQRLQDYDNQKQGRGGEEILVPRLQSCDHPSNSCQYNP